MKITATTEMIVIGRNAEWADMSNPNGERYGEATYLLAEASDGARWLGPVIGLNASVAEIEAKIAVAEFAYLRHGLDPRAEWSPWFPMYGSAAYMSSGQEEVDCFQERRGEPYCPA